jgi:molybdate-binding protein
MHVFDPESRDWNRAAIRAKTPTGPWVLIEWAKRQQGLILAPAISDQIEAITDLVGRRVVQRQASAGAALLFEHLIRDAGFEPEQLDVLPEIARTETDAAAAIASEKAEVAPGLEAAARQFRLGFLPTVQERFDLLIDRRAWFEPPLQMLMSFARSPRFADKAADLGGYDLTAAGTVHWNGP